MGAAYGRALVLAQKAGVDLLLVYEAIKGRMAGGRTLDMKAPKIAEGNFEPGFKMDLHIKALKNALPRAGGRKIIPSSSPSSNRWPG